MNKKSNWENVLSITYLSYDDFMTLEYCTLKVFTNEMFLSDFLHTIKNISVKYE